LHLERGAQAELTAINHIPAPEMCENWGAKDASRSARVHRRDAAREILMGVFSTSTALHMTDYFKINMGHREETVGNDLELEYTP